MTDKESLLKQAIESGEVVTIVYRGGSQPGAQRQIQPRSVGSGRVRALDIASHAVKTYTLSKVEIVTDNNTAPGYDPAKKSQPPPPNIPSGLADHLDAIKAAGWHIEMDNNNIALHDHFKNGKPKKTPVAGIEYREYTVEGYINDQGDLVEEQHLSARPWYVYGAVANARTYKDLGHAIETFLQITRKLTPAN